MEKKDVYLCVCIPYVCFVYVHIFIYVFVCVCLCVGVYVCVCKQICIVYRLFEMWVCSAYFHQFCLKDLELLEPTLKCEIVCPGVPFIGV